jgi:hypothetical protein
MRFFIVGAATICILAICVFSVWSMVYFSENCLRSHEVPYTYTTSHCVVYSKKGICRVSVPIQQVGYETICDEWKGQER